MEDTNTETVRALSIKVIDAVEKSQLLDKTLNSLFQRENLDSKQKSLIYEITSGTIRWKGFFKWILEGFVEKPIKDRNIKYLLWITLYQITFMKKSYYHVINEAVEYAKTHFGKYEGNFVNAILRRYGREMLNEIKEIEPETSVNTPYRYIKKKFKTSTLKSISIGYSFPEWLIERWLKRYGEDETIRLCSHINTTPFFTIKIHANEKEKIDIILYFEKKGINLLKAKFLENSYYVEKLMPLIDDPFFKKGLISIQDEASQFAGIAVQPEKGETILDACSGLGTKALQIKQITECTVVYSIDRDMKKLKHNNNRGNIINGNVMMNPFKNEIFDKILLDAPCSSVGIIRKHPEIKWRLTEKDIEKHSTHQFSMIESLWP
ncbi:MAG: hypothetical protein N2596_02455, partial [Syntrophorhabdaceae bacterium]|nr:hypothetical protein [Syntrophorhabdaceae bacterium]